MRWVMVGAALQRCYCPSPYALAAGTGRGTNLVELRAAVAAHRPRRSRSGRGKRAVTPSPDAKSAPHEGRHASNRPDGLPSSASARMDWTASARRPGSGSPRPKSCSAAGGTWRWSQASSRARRGRGRHPSTPKCAPSSIFADGKSACWHRAIRSAMASARHLRGTLRRRKCGRFPRRPPSRLPRAGSAGRCRRWRRCRCTASRSTLIRPLLHPGARILALTSDARRAGRGGAAAGRIGLRRFASDGSGGARRP